MVTRRDSDDSPMPGTSCRSPLMGARSQLSISEWLTWERAGLKPVVLVFCGKGSGAKTDLMKMSQTTCFRVAALHGWHAACWGVLTVIVL